MKKIIPFGNRILCKRRRVGEKLGGGLIVASQETADRPTDIADVTQVPDMSFIDEWLISNAKVVLDKLADRVKDGDVNAFNALLQFNEYLKSRTLKVGDTVMISKYVGTDFFTTEESVYQTIVNSSDIIGAVKNG